MKNRDILISLFFIGGWASMLFSVALYLLFWRVDNEPGAKAVPALWYAAVTFCSLGGLAVLGSQIYLIIQKAWTVIFVLWGLSIAMFIGAIYLSPILLLLLV